MQNADDAKFATDVEPCAALCVVHGSVMFSTNEVGFDSGDVLALCDVAHSSKTSNDGSIGEKGATFQWTGFGNRSGGFSSRRLTCGGCRRYCCLRDRPGLVSTKVLHLLVRAQPVGSTRPDSCLSSLQGRAFWHRHLFPPYMMIKPNQVVPHRCPLGFWLVDAVAEAFVNHHFHRHASIFETLP